MATIRANILQSLVTRLATISGWTVRLRDVENVDSNAPVIAIVYPIAEDKQFDSSDAYLCTLRVGVLVTARIENADDVDSHNPFLYLDRLIAAIEKKVHSPDSWGADPSFSDLEVNGHEVDEVEGDPTSVIGFVRLTFRYRHKFQDPDAP